MDDHGALSQQLVAEIGESGAESILLGCHVADLDNQV